MTGTLSSRLTSPWVALLRWNKPSGRLILLIPAGWSLWLNPSGTPSLQLILQILVGGLSVSAAGCIANDVYVAILEAPQDTSAADFDREVKDCCTAAAAPLPAQQNMVVKWRREVLSTGPVANVPDHIAQTVNAMQVAGATVQLPSSVASASSKDTEALGGQVSSMLGASSSRRV